jgi:Zn-dependent membrane protease YugP
MFSPTYYLFALPALLLGLYAQYRVRAAYGKYHQVANRAGLPGLEIARRLLSHNGLRHVEVREVGGRLSDHYDPRKKVLSLSSEIARTASVASLGIVAHEVGHALQDARAYGPLKLRAGLVPVVQIGSWLGPIIFLGGMVLPFPNLSLVGLVLFSGTLLFALVTLPVELDASRRAVAMLSASGMVSPLEQKGAKEVLSAAALTYVAAAAQAISTILYYLFLMGGRRRD